MRKKIIPGLYILIVSIMPSLLMLAPANAFPQYGKIVFNSDRDGDTDVYVMNTHGGAVTNLTNNSGSDYNANPQMSPDGDKIVFESNRDAGDNEIYIMDVDGSNQTRLTSSAGYDQRPAISPDGTKIAFESNRDGNREIYIMNSDGTGQTNISNSSTTDDRVSFSPDGTKVVFVSYRDGNDEIYSMNIDGTNVQRLTNNSDVDGDPAFSPDGTKIAFNSLRGGALNYNIYTMNSDGSSQTAITNTSGAGYYQPSYSPDGSAIVFNYNNSNNEIYTMNSNGTNQQNVSDSPDNDFSPHFTYNTVPLNSYTNGSEAPKLVITSNFSSFDYNYQGTLTVSGQAGNVTVSSGSTIKGTGVVALLDILSGGTLAPGESPGCLSSGNLTLAGTFEVEIAGNTACTEYDQTQVTGIVDVTGGQLDVSFLDDFQPEVGDEYTIIDNDGSDGIVGTLSGLAEGATFSADGVVFRVSYEGGDGNDLVLSTLEVPAEAPNTGSSSNNPSIFWIFAGIASIIVGYIFVKRKSYFAR